MLSIIDSIPIFGIIAPPPEEKDPVEIAPSCPCQPRPREVTWRTRTHMDCGGKQSATPPSPGTTVAKTHQGALAARLQLRDSALETSNHCLCLHQTPPLSHQSKNHAKNAHFPSGTNRNQARIFARYAPDVETAQDPRHNLLCPHRIKPQTCKKCPKSK